MKAIAYVVLVVCALSGDARAQFGDEDAPNLFVHNAMRCNECHGKMVREWKTSAHARANHTAAYKALAAKAGAKRCEGCHAPLKDTPAKSHTAASEGVTCIACHATKEAHPDRAGGKRVVTLQDATMYASLCDAKQHYFHKMGCSPLHETSEFCGSCHLYYHERGGVSLPVYTEFEDWSKGPGKEQGADCQSCHMPRVLGEVAKGSRVINHVSHHGLWDAGGKLRASGVSVSCESVSDTGERREVHIVVHNDGAGHYVPGGSPLRKFVLTVESVDDSGKVIDRGERSWGRLLVDSKGEEVPFFLAEKVGADTRLAPNEARRETFHLRLPPRGGALRIAWAMRAVNADVAQRFAFEPAADTPLGEMSVPVVNGKAAPMAKKVAKKRK